MGSVRWVISVRGVVLGAMLAIGCKAEESDGGTDTDGSTGSDFSAGPHGNVSQDDDGGPSSFTTSPADDGADDGVDDGVDDGADDAPPGDSTGRGSDGSSGAATGDSGDGSETGGGTTEGGDDGGEGGECCMEQDAGGCGGGAIERCVCAEDEFCCTTAWDVVCTVQVVTLGCGTCPGIGGDGDCCAPNGTPGCDDDEIEACVCGEDFVCCTQEWDQLCVDAVESASCGRCP